MKKKRTVLCFPRGSMAKILLKMKLLTILLLSVFAVSAANNSYSQQTKFNLKLSEVSVKEVFEEIEKNSEFILLYDENDVDVTRTVNVSVENKTVEDILDQVFKGTQNAYKIYDRQIVILEDKNIEVPANENEPTESNKQEKTITGKVTDKNGEPMPGVTVIVKGTTVGITTDFDGNYTLEIPADAEILLFSFVGMKSQEIALTDQTQIDVVLEEETLGLDEVVVVGYGTQKKSNITGAIASVKSEDFENRSTANAASAIQGKVAGVQIVNNSGSPGASSTVRIRGYSSNGSSDPLYIVDGLKVTDIDYLDPGNIESMEILKDAASAAIYGAEAGNGVVLITTKTGKKGGSLMKFDSQYSISRLAKKLDVLNADEFITYMLEVSPTNAERLDMFYYNDPSAYVNNKLADTDWQDEVYEKGVRQQYNVSFQGGTENGSLYISLGYLDHDGIVVGSNDKYNRITGQFNGNYNVKKWLEVGITNSIETSKRRSIGENAVLYGTPISMINLVDPLTPVEYSHGLVGTSLQVQEAVAAGYFPTINPETGNYYGVSSFNTSNPNPIAALQRDNEHTDAFRINGTLYGNFKPFKNFVYTSRLGYRLSNSEFYRYMDPNWSAPTSNSVKPRLEVSQRTNRYYQWENFANYSFDIQKSTISVLGGMSYIKNRTNFMSSVTDELESTAENYRYLDYSTTTANDRILGNQAESVQIAYFGRLTWDYANKYNVQVNFRADSYDAAYLDLDHNWGYFPSVSAGWTVTNEDFMKNLNRDFLSSLKLRASYGKNGSISNLGGYMYAATLNSSPILSGGQFIVENYKTWMNDQLYIGIRPSSYLANPNLRWEESKQLNLGLDVRYFKDRLSLTADYFNKNTDGLLIQSSALLTTGTSYVFQNVGVVKNHGFELDMEWKDVIKNEFKYSVKANIATVKNNVNEYKGEGVRISGSSLSQSEIPISFFEEGYPIWYLRGYKIAGVSETDGSPIFEDITNDGEITDADRTNLGSGIPDFTYGATLTLAYKNFDFLMYGTGAYGQELMYGISRVNVEISNRPQFLFDNRWTPENTVAQQPAPYYNTDVRFLNSDAFVFDGSYFKIKQIQLGYNVPASLLNKLQISALRAYMSLDDFFTFTKYPGNDPEVRPLTASSMAIDLGGYPIAKTVMFGVNVTF